MAMAIVAAAATGIAKEAMGAPHDELAQLTGPESHHLVGMLYRIEVNDGRIFSGNLPENGEMPRIGTASRDSYDIYWGDEALARGDEE